MIKIEFFGLPGSGKSTICQKMLEHLSKKDITFSCLDDLKIKQNKLVFLKIRFIKYVVNSISYLKKNNNHLFVDDLKRFLILPSITNFFKKNQNVILDEGVVQGYVSALFDRNVSEKDLYATLKPLLSDDVVYIYVDTSPVESSERIDNRNTPNHGRCDYLAKSARMTILKIQHCNFVTVSEFLKKDNFKLIHFTDFPSFIKEIEQLL